jgi:Cys-tRNA(Pro)/Cys-tRNA(Cys) deacylase
MAEKATKLNSMRLLEAHGVSYEVMTFGVEEKPHDATEVAALIGVPVHEVYKTLVVLPASGGKPVLCMIAADKHLDLKRFAAAIGQKKMVMATHAEAEQLTGLKVGGIGALALVQKHWAVYLDQLATRLEKVNVSGGQRGVNLRVRVSDLIRMLNASVVEATTDAEGA